MLYNYSFLSLTFLLLVVTNMAFSANSGGGGVVVDTKHEGQGTAVTSDNVYASHVTLYIENEDGTRTPSGWSTRVEDGATTDTPFEFQPGKNLIAGWTQGVLQMKVGERAEIHIPSELGYGSRPMGSKGGAFFIPANSNLLFDIEILGEAGEQDL
jgi:FKBP-type peptidyl-prolyl cis-trans isomerase